MDYVREYRRFVNSHYFNGAIRITAGITLPAILLGYLHNLSTGIVLSIGAMCVANTDNPGPIHHRRVMCLPNSRAISRVRERIPPLAAA